MVGDEPGRVGVVGGHDRLAVQRLPGGAGIARQGPIAGASVVRGPARPGRLPRAHGQAGPPQACQPGPDPLPELGGGLAGEGEAEHPLRRDHAVGDQPDQPGRHGLALARARAGDHGQRLQRRGDHGRLLAGRLGQAEQHRQLGGAVPGLRRHGVTCSPDTCAGQLEATGQLRQPGFSLAWNSGPAMPAATVSTSSRAHPGSGSSASELCGCTRT